jgi:hypothetical protein
VTKEIPTSTPNCFKAVAIGSALFQAPLWAFVQGTLPFLLFKHLEISPLLFALFVALKPTSGLLAPYWQLFGRHSPVFIHLNLSWSCWLAGLPFVLGFWVEDSLFWVLATAIFLILAKGRQGAWSELIRGLPEPTVRVVSAANSLGYGLGMILPVAAGHLLDVAPEAWHWLPFVSGILMIGSGFLLHLLPQTMPSCVPLPKAPLRTAVVAFRQSPLFYRFQLAMMLAGSGLMIIQPAIPSLLMDRHSLGYAECALIFGGCKALGYIVSSPIWAAIYTGKGVVRLSASAAWLSFLFVLGILMASDSASLGCAYLLYGCMQGASELSWQLAPVEFGRYQSALPYASAASFLMGLRGCVIPFLGSLLLSRLSFEGPFIIGGLLTAIGAIGFSLLVRLQSHQARDATDRSGFSPKNVLTESEGSGP